MVVVSQPRNPHAFSGLPWIAKVKQGCVKSRDAFVSARGLVNAVRKGMGETQTPQTNLRNERGRGFGLMLIDPFCVLAHVCLVR